MKYQIGSSFVDKYNRNYKIVEGIKREGYEVYNCYPIKEKPKKVVSEWDKQKGFKFEPYLDITDEGMDNIFVKYIGERE